MNLPALRILSLGTFLSLAALRDLPVRAEAAAPAPLVAQGDPRAERVHALKPVVSGSYDAVTRATLPPPPGGGSSSGGGSGGNNTGSPSLPPPSGPTSPTVRCKIISPKDGGALALNGQTRILVKATGSNSRVKFFWNTTEIGNSFGKPYEVGILPSNELQQVQFIAEVVTTGGASARSKPITVSIITDTEPPTFTTLKKPSDGATVSGSLKSAGLVTDNTEVSSVALGVVVNGATNWTEGTFKLTKTGAYKFKIKAPKPAAGSQTVLVRAVDTAGNATVVAKNVTVR